MQLVALKQEFGVPLQAEEKRVAGMFDRFDDAIGRRCAGDQCAAHAFHRLVMGAVHLHTRAFDDAIEERTGGDGDAVRDTDGRGRLSMLQHISNLTRKVLIERSTERDIHRLHSAADGQGREMGAGREMDEIQFKACASLGDDRKRILFPFSIQRGV